MINEELMASANWLNMVTRGAFTWTVIKLRGKLTWSLSLAVWLMELEVELATNLHAFVLEKLSGGVNDVCILCKNSI